MLVGLIVFSVRVAEEVEELAVSEWFLSWSFSLACTAFVLNQIAASLLITENKRLLQSRGYEHGATVASSHSHDVTRASHSHDVTSLLQVTT